MLSKAAHLTALAGLLLPATTLHADDFPIPRECDEAVALVLDRLGEESRQALQQTGIDELSALNRTWGRGIRQGFEMNTGNVELVRSCLMNKPDSALHPANASAVIMRRVWRAVNGE